MVKTIELLDSLGFVIHPDKSEFEPSQVLEFLGFIINTVEMSLRLTSAKEIAISELCSKILNAQKVSIRTLAQLLGKLSSSFMAVPFGKLHYRALERFKTQSLKIHKGKFDRKVSLNPEARLDILWWRDNIKGSWSPIIRNNADIVKTTDASTIGWGAAKGEISTGGHFTETEKEQHINVLELMAALFGIRALCRHVFDKHILLKVDNTSAVSAINKMGSTRSLPMDKIVHLIWEWAISRNNWITVTHIPGILNIEADKKSREAETRTEWMLNKQLYRKVLNELKVHPTVDLFASRINCQIAKFYSFRPDPECYGVDAFTANWRDMSFYAFPPFSCIPRTIQKICHDKAIGILIVPNWPNQPWYGAFLDINHSVYLRF